jgi:hypothetical protein
MLISPVAGRRSPFRCCRWCGRGVDGVAGVVEQAGVGVVIEAGVSGR